MGLMRTVTETIITGDRPIVEQIVDVAFNHQSPCSRAGPIDSVD